MKTITLEVNDSDEQAIADVLAIASERDPGLVVDGAVRGAVLAEVCRDWMDSMGLVPPSAEIHCISCGCTDNEACADGCSWLVFNPDTRRGVCSNCETHRAAFEAEQRVQEFRETLA